MTTIYFNKKTALAVVLVIIFAIGVRSASAQLLTSGDLVVSMYGNVGTAATNNTYLDGQATPISLEEFAPVVGTADSATPILTETLPTTGSGSNVGIVGEFGSSSEGTIQLSGDGQYLAIGGYDGNLAENGAPPGGYGGGNTAEAQSTDTNVPRVAALIDANGNVNTSTVLNDVYNTNNPRSVYTQNGTTVYTSGQGAGKSDEGGIYYTPVGNNTTAGGTAPTGIYNAVSTRTVQAYNGNLYYSADQNSSSKGTQTGIFMYSGSPTTSQGSQTGTRITPANNGAGVNYSPQGFFFANSTTLYVADTGDPKAGGTGDGGIQKWTLSLTSGQWVLDYTLTSVNLVSPASATSVAHGETGFEALTGQIVGNQVNLFAISYTAGDADSNGFYGVTDNLSATTAAPGETMIELAQSGADNNFKGVSFTPQAVPEPSTISLMMLVGGMAGAFAAWKRKKILA